MPEYQLAQEQESRDLTARAEAEFAEGEDANNYSDTFTASTAVLRLGAVLRGHLRALRVRPRRISPFAFAGVGLIAGVAGAATQPITSG